MSCRNQIWISANYELISDASVNHSKKSKLIPRISKHDEFVISILEYFDKDHIKGLLVPKVYNFVLLLNYSRPKFWPCKIFSCKFLIKLSLLWCLLICLAIALIKYHLDSYSILLYITLSSIMWCRETNFKYEINQ